MWQRNRVRLWKGTASLPEMVCDVYWEKANTEEWCYHPPDVLDKHLHEEGAALDGSLWTINLPFLS